MVGAARPTPVFDCQVILARDAESGRLHARCANIAGPEATGSSERDVLRSMVSQFKQLMEQYAASGEPVPWKDPVDQPGEGESRRWIPVHL